MGIWHYLSDRKVTDRALSDDMETSHTNIPCPSDVLYQPHSLGEPGVLFRLGGGTVLCQKLS
jgi:hypothetical protein